MAELSAPWNGITIGDAATLGAIDAPTEWAELQNSIGGGGGITTNLGGVFRYELNELEVSGTVSPVSVATGRALVHGTWYEADAAVSVAIPTPAVSTRIDRIVLRKSWAAQTVRVTRIAGVEGGSAPAITQSAGTTWDIPLAQAAITTGGVITVTDERDFMGGHIYRRKVATETVNNSVTLQDDDDFFFKIGANEIWFVTMELNTDIGTGPDFKCTWTLPAGASMLLMLDGWDSGSVRQGIGSTPGTAVTIMFSLANCTRLRVIATLVNDVTPGTAQFQWAQNSATVEDTDILINSQMIAHRLE